MDCFKTFVESELAEMARAAAEDQIPFDKFDMAYLNKFPKEPNVWARALRYRYGPDVLRSAGPDPRDIRIRVGYEPMTISNVPINKDQLVKKIEALGHNPGMVEMSYTTGINLAKRLLAYVNGDSQDMPAYNYVPSANMKIKQNKYDDDVRGVEHLPEEEFRRTAVRVSMTPADEAFVNAFPPRTRSAALMMRYSNKMFEMPVNPDGTMSFNMPGAGGSTVRVTAPADMPALHRRWRELKEQGWDFRVDPLTSRPRAQMMLQGHEYSANYNRKGGSVQRDLVKNSRYDVQQARHLKDPKRFTSPNVPDSASVDQRRDRHKTWTQILYDDAELGYRYATEQMLRLIYPQAAFNAKFMGKLKSMKGDFLANAVQLLINRHSGDPDYKKESFRILKASNYLTAEIKKLAQAYMAADRPGLAPDKRDLDAYAGLNAARTQMPAPPPRNRNLGSPVAI